jgi:ribosome-associated protein
MIEITPDIYLDEGELKWEFVRSSGPGGQKVNKVSTAVQLRFDVIGSPSISEDVKQRLLKIGGKRVTEEGVLILNARRFRSQDRNRQDALERLVSLIRDAAEVPKPRRETKPSEASKKRRREEKRQQSAKKELRKKPELDD